MNIPYSLECTFIVAIKPATSSSEYRIIGDINLFLPHIPASEAEIDLMIADSSARQHGYGTEALCMMILYGYRTLGIK